MLHIQSSGKCKLKQQRDITHLVEWPRSRPLAPPDADEHVEQQECSHVASGNAEWHSHSGRRFGGFI